MVISRQADGAAAGPGHRDEGRLGSVLRGFRRDAGLTQHELARRAGLSLGSVSDLEQGRTRRPQRDTLEALVTALGLTSAQAGELERAAASHGLWLQVLGPLTAWHDGIAIPLGGPAQRAVLGVLALSPGSLVHRTALIDMLWPGAPPRNAVNLVQAHLTRIRKTLAAGGFPGRGLHVSSAGASYRLQASPGHLDLLTFRQLTANARTAQDHGDHAAACHLHEQAASLWRGEALADVDLLRGHPAVIALTRQRAESVVDYARIASAAGWHDQVLPLLHDLARAEPLNEQAHAQLMIALAGTGQQAEALQAYDALRRRLDDDLGMPPGPDLARAHQLVLRQDIPAASAGPSLAALAPAGESTVRIAAAPVPLRRHSAAEAAVAGVRSSMPPDTAAFTGREPELELITAAVTEIAQASGGVVAIRAIGGMPGVGKTALAVHAAHLLASEFPDRRLFADLHGHTPGREPVTAFDALAGLLAATGMDPKFLPGDEEGRAGMWRDRMTGQRALIVLDNASSSAQVAPLLPGAPGCLVLVTSRRHLADLPGAVVQVLVEVLPEDQAAEMLIRLAPRAADQDPAAVAELTRLAGYLPLAVSLLARVYARHPAWSLTDLATETRARLLTLSAEHASVAAAFGVSLAHLDPAWQRFFACLGLHPGTTFDAYAAAALAGVSLDDAGVMLHGLHGEGMLTETAYRRYGMHDVICRYARQRAGQSMTPGERAAAVDRLLDYYQHTAARAEARLAAPARGAPGSGAGGPLAVVPVLDDDREALAWLRAERVSLLACIDHAAAEGMTARVVALTAAIGELLNRDGPWPEAITRHQAAARAAESLSVKPSQASALLSLAGAQRLAGDYPAAAQAATRALKEFGELGDRLGQASARTVLADTRRLTGDFPAAAGLLEQALGAYAELDDRPGQARAIYLLGIVRMMTDDYPAAARLLEQALGLFRDLADRFGQVLALRFLGEVQRVTGDFTGAGAAAEQALGLSGELGDRFGHAQALNLLGDLRRDTGDFAGAAAAAEQALGIYGDLGNRKGQAGALWTLGGVRRLTGDYPAAADALDRALGIYQDLGDPNGEANALACLGAVRRDAGDYPAAAAVLAAALRIFQDVGDRGGEAAALNDAGALHLARADLAAAGACYQQALDLARQIGDAPDEALALAGLGRCARAAADTATATALLGQALQILREVGAPEAAEVAAELGGLTTAPSAGPAMTTGTAAGPQVPRPLTLAPEFFAGRVPEGLPARPGNGDTDEGDTQFGPQLRARRQSAGLSQEELAERSGLTVRTVRNLERGRSRWPYRDTLRRLADALGLGGAARAAFLAGAGRRLGPGSNGSAEAIVASRDPDDAEVAAPGRASQRVPRPDGVPVPRQLPAGIRHFTGRKPELDFLTAMMQEPGSPDGGSVVILVIAGTAGVGKTALAVHWAHQHAVGFPDGQLYADLRGFDPGGTPVDAAVAVRRFLDALHVPPARVPADSDAQFALYRSMLAGQRVLIILDNARDADQVRPLLPGAGGCTVLITSRSQLTSLVAVEGAVPVPVGLLAPQEARDLLARRLGADRVGREQAAADEVAGLCARLPLALNIAAARAAARPAMPLRELAARLCDARLDQLSAGGGHAEVRAVFSWSYRALSAPAARLFRLLGLHPGPDISLPAIASLAAVDHGQARLALDELAGASLLAEHSPGRYMLHDLLRAYAAEQARDCDSEDERRAAVRRVLDHYLLTAHAAALLFLRRGQPPRLPATSPGVTGTPLPDEEHARAWCRAEQAVLPAAVTLAAGTGHAAHAWQLAWSIEIFPEQWRRWQEQLATGQAALAAAELAGDQAGQAYAHRHLGRALLIGGHHAQARDHLRRALDLFGQSGDPVSQADTDLSLADALSHLGQPEQALARTQRSLTTYQAAGHDIGQAWTLHSLGWQHLMLGNYEQALATSTQALALIPDEDDPVWRTLQGATLDSIGYAHHHLGHHRDAITSYQQALRACHSSGEAGLQAAILDHLGDACHAAADPTAAHDAWKQSLAILEDLRQPGSEQIRAKIRDHQR
jgi:tetratricopeptide (TPR) repeat protein/transcriptional regulator with XRE-family HTH domain/DNA-binding SARP family transcriptional activator